MFFAVYGGQLHIQLLKAVVVEVGSWRVVGGENFDKNKQYCTFPLVCYLLVI